MNKAYVSLGILFFASLYMPTIMGMEQKYTQQVIKTMQKKKNNIEQNNLFIEKPITISSPTTTSPFPIDFIFQLKSYLSKKDQKSLELVCREHFLTRNNIFFMPNNLKRLRGQCKGYKSGQLAIILATMIEKNDLNNDPNAINSVKWITNNFSSLRPIYAGDRLLSVSAFAKKKGYTELCKTLIMMEQRNRGRSDGHIIEHLQEFYDNLKMVKPSDPNLIYKIENDDPAFASHVLAIMTDDVKRLEELCSQKELTIDQTSALLFDTNKEALNCFKYLWEQYKNNTIIRENLYRYGYYSLSNDIKQYLKSNSKSTFCTIL